MCNTETSRFFSKKKKKKQIKKEMNEVGTKKKMMWLKMEVEFLPKPSPLNKVLASTTFSKSGVTFLFLQSETAFGPYLYNKSAHNLPTAIEVSVGLPPTQLRAKGVRKQASAQIL